MPNYEYKCSKCGKVTEEQRPMKDNKKKKVCSFSCMGEMNLQISSASLIGFDELSRSGIR
jgi:putative FmdB family regulatory protein